MKSKLTKIFMVLVIIFTLTGCTKNLTDSNKKMVKNPETGQNLTENILCQPTNKETIKKYEENKVDIKKLPKCENFKINTGGYDGLWASIFVKPLAYLILVIGNKIGNYGVSLIIISILLRLILFPLTKKTAMQSELLKTAQKDLTRIENKYKDKNDQESMMKKSQEMTMVYKKNGINPMSGCLFSLIQLPLLCAFLEAINRVPAIFEDKLLFIKLGTTPLKGLTAGNFGYLIVIVLIGLTTYYSFKLNATSTTSNPQMEKMPQIMTVMIMFTGLMMSSALGIYWISTNLFTIVQNYYVKRSKEKYGKI